MATITGVVGAQYLRGTQAYKNKNYQYAHSTHKVDHKMKPALIVYATSKDDVAATLRHAKEQGIAVAIRTGGHQYSGASSTAAPNILLDLSKTFQGPDDRHIFHIDEKSYVRTSVSWSLGDVNAWLARNNLFVPHGQCTHVHLGGHVQTGGYGQLGRSFGLFGDHVRSLEIVDSEGNFKEVTQTTDAELFWAILGGSPGNFGVLTHFTIEVHRDADYQGSLGLKAIYWYTPETVKRLVDILVEMSDDDDFPQNYDLCVSVLSSSFKLIDLWPDIDGYMREHYPEVYGENGMPMWPRMIVVYAQWVPLHPGDVADMSWFNRINEGSLVGNVEQQPMSQLTGKWIFRNIREFDYPYVKRAYSTNSTTLGPDGWADWVTKRIDAIVTPEKNRLWLSCQLQAFGGKHSQIRKDADNGTSYSWRDTTMVAVLDCFYDDDTKERAEDWQKVNDHEGIGPNGIFSKTDRRLLWGSYGDFDLDNVWDLYYDDREKYEKLMQIRKRADPDGTFTPNPFCVRRAGVKRTLTNGSTHGDKE